MSISEAVRLVDSMGDDLRVVNAARVSMAKRSEWKADGRTLKDDDAKLIRYLAKHNHWTPFSHVMITTQIEMPIFIARQWFRHTVGFTRNETSRRYVDAPPRYFMPAQLRTRADHVKQGSSEEPHEFSGHMLARATGLCNEMDDFYALLIADGVAPEQARMFLPQNMMTEFYETASLAAYARLCKQRLDPHAQEEIRVYAVLIAEICQEVAPVSWAALMGVE